MDRKEIFALLKNQPEWTTMCNALSTIRGQGDFQKGRPVVMAEINQHIDELELAEVGKSQEHAVFAYLCLKYVWGQLKANMDRWDRYFQLAKLDLFQGFSQDSRRSVIEFELEQPSEEHA